MCVKTNKMSMRPAKTELSMDIHPVWSESLLCAQWVTKAALIKQGWCLDWSGLQVIKLEYSLKLKVKRND